jgi:NitT/TauT family transport system ATP-binding protein
MEPWLNLESVGFSYPGKTIFRSLNLVLSPDQPVLAIVGPSGVGKTTLIKLLAGHLSLSRGTIAICGERVDGPTASRPVVFQDYNLFPWKNVLDNVVFGLKCAGVPPAERERRGRELLRRMRLEGTEALLPPMLSGGMQQRVGLARALAVSPKCVLMDEPFSALDNELRESFCLGLSELVAEGSRFILVTHDLSDAIFLGDRILVLRGNGEEVEYQVETPRHPRPLLFRYTPEFLGHIERLKRLLAGG